MKTDELVGLLARAGGAPDTAWRGRAVVALTLGCLASLALTAGLLGLNRALPGELASPALWLKEGFCLLASVAALALLLRLGRPGARPGRLPVLLAAPFAFLWLVAGVVLLQADTAQRAVLLLGHTALVCPWLIALVALPVFGACIFVLRSLAPTRLRLAGAAAGCAAGTLGATVYSLHCPEFAVPFVAVWYVAGIALTSALGGLAGPRLLRW